MNGVYIKQIEIKHEDTRRIIKEIQNGLIDIKNLKILEVKEDCYLGGKTGHWHQYPEMMVILKGECSEYTMENIDTEEKETFKFKEGDIVFRTGRIIHGGFFKKGSIILDGGVSTYLNADFNDIPKEITK